MDALKLAKEMISDGWLSSRESSIPLAVAEAYVRREEGAKVLYRDAYWRCVCGSTVRPTWKYCAMGCGTRLIWPKEGE